RLVAKEWVIEGARKARGIVAQAFLRGTRRNVCSPRRADVSHGRRSGVAPTPPGSGSTALAPRAEEGRAAALDDAPDGAVAAHAGLAGATVHARLELELAGGAVRVLEVAQGRAAE